MTPPPAQPAAPYHAGNSAVAVAAPGNREIRRWRFHGRVAPCQLAGLQLVELIRKGRISASIPWRTVRRAAGSMPSCRGHSGISHT